MGKFKSSGMLISTGTGSSGWLLSIKRMTPERVKAVQDLMHTEDESYLVSISSSIYF